MTKVKMKKVKVKMVELENGNFVGCKIMDGLLYVCAQNNEECIPTRTVIPFSIEAAGVLAEQINKKLMKHAWKHDNE